MRWAGHVAHMEEMDVYKILDVKPEGKRLCRRHRHRWEDNIKTPRERAPSTHWVGGSMGPRAGLDMMVRKQIPSPYWDSNPQSSSL